MTQSLKYLLKQNKFFIDLEYFLNCFKQNNKTSNLNIKYSCRF